MARLADGPTELVDSSQMHPSRTITSLLSILLVAGVLALLAFGGMRLVELHHADSRNDDKKQAVTAASTEVQALTSVSATTTDSALARILDGATADFRDQFKQQAEVFRKTLKDANVKSTAKIVSAGLVTLKGDKATVLVAASGTVTNSKSTYAQARNYRLKVTLDRMGDSWLVSGMDFV